MKLGLGLRLGGSGNRLPRYVTDFFNGFESAGSTYSGGPTVVADNTGTLVTSPAGVLPIEGMRLATTVAEGAELGPELVVNGDFSDGTTGWASTGNASWSSEEGAAKFTGGSETWFKNMYTTYPAGKTFLVQYELLSVGAGLGVRVYIGGSTYAQTSCEKTVGTRNYLIVADGGTQTVINIQTTGGTWKVDNISIREVIPTWLPTDLSGDPIHTSTPLSTRKGTVSVYDESYKGPLIEPARTNKLICRKSEPVDLTNIFAAGGDSGNIVLSVVDATEALADAKLSHLCTSGKVYRIDNTAGAANGGAQFAGSFGTTNACIGRAYVRVVSGSGGKVNISGTLGATSFSNTTFQPVETVPISGNTAYTFRIYADIGAIVEFILMDLQEGAFLTSPICKASDGSDPLTSLTRPAANLTRPTAGTALEGGNNFAIYGRVVPKGVANLTYLFHTGLGFDPLFGLYTNTDTLRLRKRDSANGDNIIDSGITTPSAVPFEYLIYQHSVYGAGVSVKVDGGTWSAWATLTGAAGTANATKQATYQIGARNNADHFAANYPFTEIIRLNPNLHPQTQLADLLAKGRV